MKQFAQRGLIWMLLLVSMSLVRPLQVVAQERIRRLPATSIAINEDILEAFVDEPCRNFEAARDAFVRGDKKQAGHHLRVGAAFLRLESARATAGAKPVLDASVRELQRLATSIEDNQVRTVQILYQTFARAHYALAGHHCIQSAHRCCQPAAFQNKQEMSRVGRDLKATAIHLERGALWAGDEPDREILKELDAARFSTDRLFEGGGTPEGDVKHAIHSVRDKLERLTGRKIMLARPLAEDDKLGPSIMR